jgi:hypothetical protein
MTALRKMKKDRLRALLWLDCTAAGTAGVALLAVSRVLSSWFQVPRAVLVAIALVNLVYGGFSCSLVTRDHIPLRAARALVVANLAWTAVCAALALAFVFGGTASWPAVVYVLLEGAFVGALALFEARELRSQTRVSVVAEGGAAVSSRRASGTPR